jgi:two-component system, LytTR family, sensor kinase
MRRPAYDHISGRVIDLEAYRRVRRRNQELNEFVFHVVLLTLANACLFAINLMSSPRDLWFYWPLALSAAAILIHATAIAVRAHVWHRHGNLGF